MEKKDLLSALQKMKQEILQKNELTAGSWKLTAGLEMKDCDCDMTTAPELALNLEKQMLDGNLENISFGIVNIVQIYTKKIDRVSVPLRNT